MEALIFLFRKSDNLFGCNVFVLSVVFKRQDLSSLQQILPFVGNADLDFAAPLLKWKILRLR